CDGVTDLPKISSYICSVIMSQSLTMLRLSPYTSLFRSGPRRFGLAAANGPVVPSPHYQHHGIRQHLAMRRLEPMAELAPGTRAPEPLDPAVAGDDCPRWQVQHRVRRVAVGHRGAVDGDERRRERL